MYIMYIPMKQTTLMQKFKALPEIHQFKRIVHLQFPSHCLYVNLFTNTVFSQLKLSQL